MDLKNTLSPRQYEILRMIADGRSNKEMCAALKIKVRTLHVHKYWMTLRLGLKSMKKQLEEIAKAEFCYDDK